MTDPNPDPKPEFPDVPEVPDGDDGEDDRQSAVEFEE